MESLGPIHSSPLSRALLCPACQERWPNHSPCSPHTFICWGVSFAILRVTPSSGLPLPSWLGLVHTLLIPGLVMSTESSGGKGFSPTPWDLAVWKLTLGLSAHWGLSGKEKPLSPGGASFGVNPCTHRAEVPAQVSMGRAQRVPWTALEDSSVLLPTGSANPTVQVSSPQEKRGEVC